MTDLTIEMLSPEQVEAEWAALEPMFAAACRSNEISEIDVTPTDIRSAALSGLCVVFCFRKAGKAAMTLALQFTDTNGHKGAEIMAMGGRHLMRFKDAYWELILNWLKANGCVFLDAYANDRLAKIYTSKFGFDKSCTLVRMTL
jgi:hypothetical protein